MFLFFSRSEEKEFFLLRSRARSSRASRVGRVVRAHRPEQRGHDGNAETDKKHQHRYGKKEFKAVTLKFDHSDHSNQFT